MLETLKERSERVGEQVDGGYGRARFDPFRWLMHDDTEHGFADARWSINPLPATLTHYVSRHCYRSSAAMESAMYGQAR